MERDNNLLIFDSNQYRKDFIVYKR